jgi:hypothetical protein
MRPVAAAAAVAAAAGALAFACALPEARSGPEGAVEITAEPVEIAPAEIHGLRLRGTVELTSDHPAFGGLSGMLIEGDTMIAISDHGWLLQGRLVDDAGGLRPEGARMMPLLDDAGARLDANGTDAEGLARIRGGRLAVSFERDHRVTILDEARQLAEIRDRSFEQLGHNKGPEALATLPDGQLLAIAEARGSGGFPAFLVDPDGAVQPGRLPLHGREFVTGADVGPDGRLYLLRRRLSLLGGFSIRIERYRLAPDGLPLPETHELLAAFHGLAIDNMEAIAVWRDGADRTRLAIASDNNYYTLLQRTLLMDFEVLD